MFIVLLNYVQPLDVVDGFVAEHRQFLEQHYASGHFLVSGRKEPRTGGVIIAQAASKSELEDIIEKDPFFQNKIAEYQIIEFIPGMSNALLAGLI
ncbi:YciI family protein [Iodobacter sp. LRB]|uniref:YciI family protein n=1 Tax=unclassified Iodobacter TaxID=235634 RepID=UPI000C0DA191|nr:YciI family protein [Iodobacter sp. BJB302]PHV02915.1 GTP cyclohydrolase [Iodobacter sp. BJB302]